MSIEIKVVGFDCPNCKELYLEAAKAAAHLREPATLVMVDDIIEIIPLKLTAVPALIINGEVKSVGRVPHAAEITTWLTNAMR